MTHPLDALKEETKQRCETLLRQLLEVAEKEDPDIACISLLTSVMGICPTTIPTLLPVLNDMVIDCVTQKYVKHIRDNN